MTVAGMTPSGHEVARVFDEQMQAASNEPPFLALDGGSTINFEQVRYGFAFRSSGKPNCSTARAPTRSMRESSNLRLGGEPEAEDDETP